MTAKTIAVRMLAAAAVMTQAAVATTAKNTIIDALPEKHGVTENS